MNIAYQTEVEIRGLKYRRITLASGEVILKRKDKKSGMWVTLRFAESCSEEHLEDIKDTIIKVLTGVV